MNKSENIFQIFYKSLLVYFKNFFPFSRAMLFPVFGQVIGIFLILGPVYFYRTAFIDKQSLEFLQANILFIFLGLIIIVIPGFLLFLKAFWDYMVAMVSLNTMTADFIENKEIVDFKTHNNAVNLRTKDYIVLLFILMGFWLVLMLFPFIVFGVTFFFNKMLSGVLFILSVLLCMVALAVLSVYLCLSFQIFAFEEITPISVIKKSFNMIEKHFWQAVILGVILFMLSGTIIPIIFQEIIKNTPIMDYLAVPFNAYWDIMVQVPVIAELSEKLAMFNINIPKELVLSAIAMIVTAFILPLGSAGFTLLYLDIKKRKSYDTGN